MMGGGSEDQFFDTRDEASTASSLGSDCCVNSMTDDCALGYEFWTKDPGSVNERRERFLKWMGLSPDWRRTSDVEDEDSDNEDVKKGGIDRLIEDGESVLANLDSENQFFSSRSIQSLQSYDGFDGGNPINVQDNGTESVMDEMAGDESLTTSLELGPERMISLDEFQKTLSSSSVVHQLLTKECKKLNISDPKKKSNWFQKLHSVIQIVDRAKGLLSKTQIDEMIDSTTGRVRVSVSKKNSKELSSLCTGQEFPAHVGSILTMKFSPDGMFLASAGEDGVVRVWKVLEDEISNKFSPQDSDPSCLYFSLDQFSKLAREVPKGEDPKKNMNRSSDSACVVLPPKVFKLSEKPLHEFHGHSGEVLALSWSKNGHLLSSSVDKSARLWRVGNENCLGVYSHNNFVTCVEFNPMDDNSFISGSIDGKLRIWEVEGGRVIDWTELREIVTAVGYRPDGKGGIVGFMDGTCRYYDLIDNCLQLGDSICLKGKKKLPGKKITGFQYCPTDAGKVMVTSADAQVQILSGTNIVCKFKSKRSSASQIPAAFTSDGGHIVSAAEDSNIRVWNCSTLDQKSSSPKKVWSCESFLSRNASIAVPWCGLKHKLGALPGNILGNGHFDEKLLQKIHAAFPDYFSTSLGYFLDALHKASATWPEEKLQKLNSVPFKAGVCKSDFKFLRNAWMNAFNSPNLWGLVIVTAGWDGCIRTFLNYGLPIKF